MNYYNQLAPGYTTLHQEEQERKLRIIAAQLTVRKEDRLLDVGCGPCFAAELFDCEIVGIDPSRALLEQAPIKNKVVGRAEQLPFPDKSFDIVLAVTAVHHFENVEQGLKEIARVAKREVVLTVLKKSSKAAEIGEMIRAIFSVQKVIEEQHDWIFFCTPKVRYYST